MKATEDELKDLLELRVSSHRPRGRDAGFGDESVGLRGAAADY